MSFQLRIQHYTCVLQINSPVTSHVKGQKAKTHERYTFDTQLLLPKLISAMNIAGKVWTRMKQHYNIIFYYLLFFITIRICTRRFFLTVKLQRRKKVSPYMYSRQVGKLFFTEKGLRTYSGGRRLKFYLYLSFPRIADCFIHSSVGAFRKSGHVLRIFNS